jgi:GT2 family glycosyltransferase
VSLLQRTGLVIIGRNEGERLRRCLASARSIPERVYVDSGSTDGSVALARSEGFTVVELPVPPVFTAARARNAGLECLLARDDSLEFVQFVDGDCEIRAGWLQSALEKLEADPGLAAVFGRRRERHPEASCYNALCDDEWNIPVGEAAGCGGDAMFRVSALRDVHGFNAAMIAGEDSELSMRLRKAGWKLWRIDAEMTWHDAAIMKFSQWCNRTRRAGHGFAEMAFLHPDARNPDWPRTVRSIIVWGGIMPAVIVASVIAALASVVLLLPAAAVLALWSLRTTLLARRERRRGLSAKLARASALLLMIGKIPQFAGLLGFHRNRILGRASRLIEYK